MIDTPKPKVSRVRIRVDEPAPVVYAPRPVPPPTAQHLRVQALFDAGTIDESTGLPAFMLRRYWQ